MKNNLPNQRTFDTIDSSAPGVFRAALFVIYTIFFTLNLTAAAQAVVPVNGTPPVLTPVTINAGPGDQYDPHVSGDWAAYTSDLAIRYYNFSTAVDAAIPVQPGPPLVFRDLLPDVSGTKITFTRGGFYDLPPLNTGEGAVLSIMVFDAASAAAPIEIDPVPFVPPPVLFGSSVPQRLGSAIGGGTVAYRDELLGSGLYDPNGELIIHDLATSASVRITNDALIDRRLAVSPDGAVVTWEHSSDGFQLDIWQAVKTGPGWSVGIVSDSLDPESNPDTNGALVVFDAVRGGSADIFWRPVAGGAEVQLEFSGVERNPSIAGNFIAFESKPTLVDPTDLYVYDLATNRLYQITNTPTVTEQLNDITVLGDGSVRVVWATDEDGPTSRNVRGATFSLQAIDNEPPVFTQPANIIVNATTPTGAVVNYPVPVATDNVGVTSLVCTPASGGVFPIGTTSVQCTAGDAAGNTANAFFTVKVKGAPEQIVDLVELAKGMALPPLLKTKLLAALQTALANPRNKPLACGALSLFIQYVQAQPPSVISPAKKVQLIADATRIKAVLGCS